MFPILYITPLFVNKYTRIFLWMVLVLYKMCGNVAKILWQHCVRIVNTRL